jgi:protein-S-isoprenylcysteine O-methyltransferase Ste14
MNNILIVISAAFVIHIVDIVSLKKIPLLKPAIWVIGIGIGLYGIIKLCLSADKLSFPEWSIVFGWILLIIAVFVFLSALFINLPFRKTYIETGVGDKLVKTGLYSLARHPGVIALCMLLVSLILVSGSKQILIAAPIFMLIDILLVVLQDRIFFPRMFKSYNEYRKEIPMLIPNKQSIGVFIRYLREAKQKNRFQGGKFNDYTG